MKIDLYCNIPYDPQLPNAAIGYLKGYLLEHNIKTRNIYWNLILYKILRKYAILTEKYQKLTDYYLFELFTPYIAKYFYPKKSNSSNSCISKLIESIIPPHELKNLSKEFKKTVNNYIEKQELYKTEIAGFTMKTYQWTLNYYILLQLKNYNPNIKTVVGGIDSHSQAVEFMKIFKKADFAIWGEGEIPLLKLTNQIDKPSAFKNVPNLIYREKNKIISTFPIYPRKYPDINSYPFAEHNDYFKTIKKYKLKFPLITIPIWGIRSCNWNRCKFCVLNEEYTYRERPPENIVQEIEYQSQKHNIDRFMFMDTDFGRKNREEFEKLLDLLINSREKRKKTYQIIGGISPLRLDRKSIKKMKKISFVNVQIGFEAAADSLLKKMNKKHRFIHNIQALKLAEEENFPITGLNVIRNIPNEIEGDIIKSTKNLKFLRFLLHKYPLRPTKLMLFKRAPFYKEMNAKEIEEWNFNEHWEELSKLDFLTYADRFEFFGFKRKNLVNSYYWEIFAKFLNKYQSNKFSYKWIEHPDGSSEIHEKGKYYLDKTETEILKFCDTIKTFSEVKNQFPSLTEKKLHKIILPLNEVGLLYIDDSFKMMIAVISSENKEKKHDI